MAKLNVILIFLITSYHIGFVNAGVFSFFRNSFPLKFIFGTESKQTSDVQECLQDHEFEFIIVGGGTTGLVLANRLSEHFKVLVVEAGGEPIKESYIPLMSFKALWSSMDWSYLIEKQQNCCRGYKNEQPYLNSGKALGGTSSLNFMTYTRGNKRDYDHWRDLGNEGWGWDDVFPYFLKLEDYKVPRDKCQDSEKYHHEGGPMTIEIPTFKTPMAEAFLQAGWELGYPYVDYNTEKQIGFMYPPVYIRNGSRWSTNTGYLRPIRSRPNLKILTNSYVTKVLFNESTAVGILYESGPYECNATASKEVILSAGVIGSPRLLMLSGIGNKEILEKLRIPVIHHLPGVGENLQDHLAYGGNVYTTDAKETYNSVRYETKKNEKLWEETQSGPLTCPFSFEGAAFIASNYSVDSQWADFEVFFNSDNAFRILKPFLKTIVNMAVPSDSQDTVIPLVMLLRPKSRGYVALRSNDPHQSVIIEPRYLSHPDDIKVVLEGKKFVEQMMKTKAMKQFGPHLLFGDKIPMCLGEKGENYDRCVITWLTTSGVHGVGTCKMAPAQDPMAVVDKELRVHGVNGLRVVDASIMPQTVSGHPVTACIMIGEKTADVIIRQYKSM